ncbi:MAG TPA: phage major capsid protein [Aggregatilinea sp.]|uniref:phage major capsid protein n=1 Tax=Aggregatilinea sp. TaxID=2806333 RepID=UPI002CE63C6C|nr:phage major capsid protein [Aggregatilinea sp.]HML22097.1 phage major capsid protein [Aggregatilinea sp.]
MRRTRAGYRRAPLAVRQDGDLIVVRGWGMLFTNPEHLDAYDTFFATTSHLLTEFYQDAPLWYEHGMDIDYAWRPIGKRHRLELYSYGIWVEHLLFRSHPLLKRTLEEIAAGLLSYSSDSLAHYVETGFNWASGENRVWPLAGWSLTKNPAEPGLGPVTLAGFDATIRELEQASARRVPYAGTTITISSAPSIVVSPVSPDAGFPSPTTREASGAGPDRPMTQTVPGPAREASLAGLRSLLNTKGSNPMDPETLAALADFLGVEATPEAVAEALQMLLSQISDSEGEGGTQAAMSTDAPAVDLAAMRAALDLADDASVDDMRGALENMLALIDVPDGTRAYNYNALRTARQRAAALADRTPAPAPVIPPVTTGARSQRPLRSGTQAPYFNRGAERPGIVDAVLAASGRRSPRFPRMSTRDLMRSVEHATRTSRNEGFALRDAGVSYSDGPRGAFVLNEEIAAEILDPLIANEVVMAAGADTYPMNGIQSLTINKMNSLPESYWVGEKQGVPDGAPGWGVVNLNLKTLACMVRLPNRWLRTAGGNAEQKLRDAIVDSMRLKMDLSFLIGTGGKPADGSTGSEPLGLLHTPGVNVRSSYGGAPDLPMLKGMTKQLKLSNVESSPTWGWIGNPSLFTEYDYMVDTNGQPILRENWSEDRRSARLVGYPTHETTQIPQNEGDGNNETTLFFGEWKYAVVGYGTDIELLVSEHRFIDSLETVILAFIDVDFGVLYPPAFSVQPGIQIS